MNTNQPKRKGMLVFVYRHGNTDCTANGVTSKNDQVLLIGEGVAEIFEEHPDTPTLELKKAEQGGKCLHARPIGEIRWTMFGGNFIYSSDSRFSPLNGGNPIKVFDRIEN